MYFHGKNDNAILYLLLVLDKLPDLIAARKAITLQYHERLGNLPLQLPQSRYGEHTEHNYAYFPAVFATEAQCLAVKAALEKQDIYPRRYFYPSLNRLPHCQGNTCPTGEDIALRVLCLPLYYGLDAKDVSTICDIIESTLT